MKKLLRYTIWILATVITILIGLVQVMRYYEKTPYQKESFRKSMKVLLSNTDRGIQLYLNEVGRLPVSLDELFRNSSSSITNWRGPYLTGENLKDCWQKPILYSVMTNMNAYEIRSTGADGRVSDDDIILAHSITNGTEVPAHKN